MFFQWSASVTILFQSWKTSEATRFYYILSCVGISLLAFLLEGVRYAFHNLHSSSAIADNEKGEMLVPKSCCSKAKLFTRAKEVAVYGVYMTLSYLVMLVIMTFNGGIFMSVVFGHCIGTLVFPRSLRHHRHPAGYVQAMAEPINACH